MRLVFTALAALALAAILGLGATWWTVANGLPAGRLVIGAWKAAPDIGTLGADPYEIASTARSGEAPLTYGDGLAFTASTDDAGRPLDASCDYELVGELPLVRAWTLAPYRPDGERMSTKRPGGAMTNAEAVRAAGQKLTIRLSRKARPGNWTPLEGEGRFVLRLSLYDTTLGTPLQRANPTSLFAIRRGACG